MYLAAPVKYGKLAVCWSPRCLQRRISTPGQLHSALRPPSTTRASMVAARTRWCTGGTTGTHLPQRAGVASSAGVRNIAAAAAASRPRCLPAALCNPRRQVLVVGAVLPCPRHTCHYPLPGHRRRCSPGAGCHRSGASLVAGLSEATVAVTRGWLSLGCPKEAVGSQGTM